jgi:hypothetical protein
MAFLSLAGAVNGFFISARAGRSAPLPRAFGPRH